MRIAEIYKSVQGEGLLTGMVSVFIRASGCNLRCWYCDTPHTSWKPDGVDLSIDEIVAEVEEWDCQHVVVTGGEPMLFSELIPLTQRLAKIDRHVTIETAGTLYLPLACDLMSISPKLSSSTPSISEHPHWHRRHDRERHRPSIVRRLIRDHDYQVKFVVDTPTDLEEIETYFQAIPEIDRRCVLLMPQGTDNDSLAARGEWIEPYCEAHNYRFCPRRQIEWFGAVRGT